MSRKSDQRLRETFFTHEDLGVVTPRTVYVYARDWSSARPSNSFCVAVRHRRARAYWAESKATKASLDEALRSAEIWRVRAEKSYAVPYRVVVMPSVVLSMIERLGVTRWAKIDPAARVTQTFDVLQSYRTAITRKRAQVPPAVIPAIEAMLMTAEPARAWLVADYLGWNANKAPPTQTLEDLVAAPVTAD